jgi:hypothetical protein
MKVIGPRHWLQQVRKRELMPGEVKPRNGHKSDKPLNELARREEKGLDAVSSWG